MELVIGSKSDCKAELEQAALLPLIEKLQQLELHKKFCLELEVPNMDILVDSALVFSETGPNVTHCADFTLDHAKPAEQINCDGCHDGYPACYI